MTVLNSRTTVFTVVLLVAVPVATTFFSNRLEARESPRTDDEISTQSPDDPPSSDDESDDPDITERTYLRAGAIATGFNPEGDLDRTMAPGLGGEIAYGTDFRGRRDFSDNTFMSLVGLTEMDWATKVEISFAYQRYWVTDALSGANGWLGGLRGYAATGPMFGPVDLAGLLGLGLDAASYPSVEHDGGGGFGFHLSAGVETELHFRNVATGLRFTMAAHPLTQRFSPVFGGTQTNVSATTNLAAQVKFHFP